jgi:hypothetical protein
MTITIETDNLRGVIAPLYNRYPGQTTAQGAYVEMTLDGAVSADSNAEIGGGMSFDVFHGRTRRWPVAKHIRGDALADYLESDDARALLQRIYDGHDTTWDGNNNVGTMTEDAHDAESTLERELEALGEDESSSAAVWDLDNWLGHLSFDDKWPVGETLDEAVNGIEDGAEEEGVQLDGNIKKYLLDYAQHENDRDKCYRPEVLAALVADGRHPVDEYGDEWTAA